MGALGESQGLGFEAIREFNVSLMFFKALTDASCEGFNMSKILISILFVGFLTVACTACTTMSKYNRSTASNADDVKLSPEQKDMFLKTAATVIIQKPLTDEQRTFLTSLPPRVRDDFWDIIKSSNNNHRVEHQKYHEYLYPNGDGPEMNADKKETLIKIGKKVCGFQKPLDEDEVTFLTAEIPFSAHESFWDIVTYPTGTPCLERMKSLANSL